MHGYPAKVEAARLAVNRPLTLTEKILYAHLWQGNADVAFESSKSLCRFCAGPCCHAGCNSTNGVACNLCRQEDQK